MILWYTLTLSALRLNPIEIAFLNTIFSARSVHYNSLPLEKASCKVLYSTHNALVDIVVVAWSDLAWSAMIQRLPIIAQRLPSQLATLHKKNTCIEIKCESSFFKEWLHFVTHTDIPTNDKNIKYNLGTTKNYGKSSWEYRPQCSWKPYIRRKKKKSRGQESKTPSKIKIIKTKSRQTLEKRSSWIRQKMSPWRSKF